MKYIDDRYFWNIDIVEKLRIFDLKATNKFEHLFLNLLDFSMYVSPSEFDEYFKWFVLYSKFRQQEDVSNPVGQYDQKMNVENWSTRATGMSIVDPKSENSQWVKNLNI